MKKQIKNKGLHFLPLMEDYAHLHYIGEPCANKKNGLIAYTESHWNESCAVKDQHWQEQIRVLTMPGRKTAVITAGGMHESNPAISDDGTIYFLSDAAQYSLPVPGSCEADYLEARRINELFAAPQLYSFHDGVSHQLTHMLHGINDFVLSPDEKRILFTSWWYQGDTMDALSSTRSEQALKEKVAEYYYEPIICEAPSYKSDEELGYKSIRKQTLWCLELSSGKVTCLLTNQISFTEYLWMPDSTYLLYQTASAQNMVEFYQLSVTTAAPKSVLYASCANVCPAFESQTAPIFDKESNCLIFAGMQPNAEYSDARLLYQIPAEGGCSITALPLIDPALDTDGIFPQDYLFPSRGSKHHEFLLMPDERVYYVTAVNGDLRICSVPLTSSNPMQQQDCLQTVSISLPVCVSKEGYNYHGLSIYDEHTILCMSCSGIQMTELVLLDIYSGDITPLTHLNPWMDGMHFGSPIMLQVETLDAADTIQGWMIPPSDVSQTDKKEPAAAKKYPAILYCHGGPTGFYCSGFDLEFQALAAAGFVVIYGNPRGGTGYGHQHGLDHYAYDNTAMNDLHQLTQKACETYDFIDSHRLGICGGSYGGYMTAYTASHSQRFKAACAHRPLLNFQMILASSHSAGHGHSRDLHESYLDYMLQNMAESVTAYAEAITIPFQLLQSEKDANCVPEQAHQLYTVIKELHPEVPCQLVLYPDSGHGLLKKGPMYLTVAHMKDNMNWFLKYL